MNFKNMEEYDKYLKDLQKEELKYEKMIRRKINRTLLWARIKKIFKYFV